MSRSFVCVTNDLSLSVHVETVDMSLFFFLENIMK